MNIYIYYAYMIYTHALTYKYVRVVYTYKCIKTRVCVFLCLSNRIESLLLLTLANV